MKRCILALLVALVAFPSVALAIPDNIRQHWVPQSDADHVAARHAALGALEQQASAPAPTPAASEFDWVDAGVGAAAVIGLAALGGLGVTALHRSRTAPLVG